MCSNFSMSSWSFVSDNAFLKIASVDRKDCKWTLHNINLDLLYNSNKNSRCLYKMDTNSMFPVHILIPEIKLHELTCLLIAKALSSIFIFLILFHFFFFNISPLMTLAITNSICIWSQSFSVSEKTTVPILHKKWACKESKQNQAIPFFLLITFWYMGPHTICCGMSVFWRPVEKWGKILCREAHEFFQLNFSFDMCVTSELDEVALGLVQLCFEKPEEWRFHRNLVPQSFCQMIFHLGQYAYNFFGSYVLELFLYNLCGVGTCTWRHRVTEVLVNRSLGEK